MANAGWVLSLLAGLGTPDLDRIVVHDPIAVATIQQLDPSVDEHRLDHLLDATQEVLDHIGVDALLTGRVKSVESIAAKVRRKGGLGEVHDRIAARVLVDDIDQCYAVADALATHLDADAQLFDDYIASPRPSGYQSLHLTLAMPWGPAEVQVRTHAMHRAAELGPAAHWRYKLATAA